MRPLTRPARLIAPKQLELDQAYCTNTESEESDLAAMFLRHTLGLQILSRQIRNFKMVHYVGGTLFQPVSRATREAEHPSVLTTLYPAVA